MIQHLDLLTFDASHCDRVNVDLHFFLFDATRTTSLSTTIQREYLAWAIAHSFPSNPSIPLTCNLAASRLTTMSKEALARKSLIAGAGYHRTLNALQHRLLGVGQGAHILTMLEELLQLCPVHFWRNLYIIRSNTDNLCLTLELEAHSLEAELRRWEKKQGRNDAESYQSVSESNVRKSSAMSSV